MPLQGRGLMADILSGISGPVPKIGKRTEIYGDWKWVIRVHWWSVMTRSINERGRSDVSEWLSYPTPSLWIRSWTWQPSCWRLACRGGIGIETDRNARKLDDMRNESTALSKIGDHYDVKLVQHQTCSQPFEQCDNATETSCLTFNHSSAFRNIQNEWSKETRSKASAQRTPMDPFRLGPDSIRQDFSRQVHSREARSQIRRRRWCV